MESFIIVAIGLFIIDAICKISYIKGGGYMRTPVMIAIDMAMNAALAGWGLYLIGGANG